MTIEIRRTEFNGIKDIFCPNPEYDIDSIIIVMPPRCRFLEELILRWNTLVPDCESKAQITLIMDVDRIDGYLDFIEEILVDDDFITANTIRSLMGHDDRSFAHPDARIKIYSTEISPLTSPIILFMEPSSYLVFIGTGNGMIVAELAVSSASYGELVRRFQVENLTQTSMLSSPIPPINAGILPYLFALTAWRIVSNDIGNNQSSDLLAKLRLAVLEQQNWDTVNDDLDWESVFKPYLSKVNSKIEIKVNKGNRLIEVRTALTAYQAHLDESIQSAVSSFINAIEEHLLKSV